MSNNSARASSDTGYYKAADLRLAFVRADNIARDLEYNVASGDVQAEYNRISVSIDAAAHAARTHVRRSIGQQFRRAREQLGLARPAPPPNQEDA